MDSSNGGRDGGDSEKRMELELEEKGVSISLDGDNCVKVEHKPVILRQAVTDEIGGVKIKLEAGNGHVGTEVNVYSSTTPSDSPDEFVESMESSEQESVHGEIVPNRQHQPILVGETVPGGNTAGNMYTQRRPCYKISNRHKMPCCRECLCFNLGRKAKNIVCRFASFRKLISRKSKTGKSQAIVSAVGFCDPTKDPSEADIKPWLASADTAPSELDLELCQHLISQLGDPLCALLQQERETLEINKELGKEGKIYWKRMVDHVREMCDVCATTVFNYHWTCDKCGFMVCPECFKARRAAEEKEQNENAGKDLRDQYKWLLCSSSPKAMHKPDLLSLTQIIPQKALESILKNLHEVRNIYNIRQNCGCPEIEKLKLNNISPMKVMVAGPTTINDAPPVKKRKTSDSQENDSEDEASSLLETVLTCEKESKNTPIDSKTSTVNAAKDESEDSDEDANDFIMDSIMPEPVKPHINNGSCNGSASNGGKPDEQSGPTCKTERKNTVEQKHFVRTNNKSYYEKAEVEVKVCSVGITKMLFPDVRHIWLCSGTLLRLEDPEKEDNYKLFKDLWVRGQPVIVSNVGQQLTQSLWTPEAFNKDCGDKKNDLVNCMTGKTVPAQLLSSFWEGFEDVSKRLKDDEDVPMLLKLKDWPPGEDFATFLPDRFEDLMSALPLKEYTHRTGRLNLAARLPSNFIKPDLGPKMYIAYGDGNHLEKGTTNLHLDISDAVNVMVHVGVPTNCDVEGHNKAVMDAIEDSDCDNLTVQRVRQGKEVPGALWHIYRPWDADKIRDLINKVSVERGHAIEPNHDPIHDQVVYLDKDLRCRLRNEYNVIGFPIVQCEGDAVFIPAGAPHQVRNLHNCIKIAEDFVSPENVNHCFQLTEEFRNLSDTHSNHEDKLQIKNIVYHAVKDALSVVLHQLQTGCLS